MSINLVEVASAWPSCMMMYSPWRPLSQSVCLGATRRPLSQSVCLGATGRPLSQRVHLGATGRPLSQSVPGGHWEATEPECV